MRKIYFTLLFISGIILTGCNNKEANLQFEKNEKIRGLFNFQWHIIIIKTLTNCKNQL
jgi:uncharacterized lipoprotein NlpE involved in copper resistance